MKNIMTGAVVERSFNPTDKMPRAIVETKEMQYVYNDGELYYFMDTETYEQIPLNKDQVYDMIVYAAVGVWGLAFGGAPTLFQTALAKTAADAADVAQSMLVTAWNTAIAGGGLVGGVLLSRLGIGAFSPALLVLLAATLLVVWAAKRQGFAAAVADGPVPRPVASGRQA